MELLLLLLLIGGFIFLYRSIASLGERVADLEGQIASLHVPPVTEALQSEHLAAFSGEAAEAPPPAPAWIEAAAAYEEPPPPEPAQDTLATLFERFVAGRLLIWVGGISLAVAGVFLVRYSIEIGLVTPPVRMILAALFGLVLVGAGEAARGRAGDPRIAQALVGAGIFVLYAAAYGSLTLYALIGLGTASALMTLITAAALFLSLRHGAPTAVMGLAGGFLTPLLVGDPEAGALTLLIYLALLNAALFWIARQRGWGWLVIAAVLSSFAWTGLLLADPDADDALAGGVFIAALSIAASLIRTGEGKGAAVVQPAAIGLIQLALLVGRADVGASAWLLFGMLAGAGLFLSTRRAELRPLPPLALLLALILLAFETEGPAGRLAPTAAAATTVLFAGFAWTRAAGEGRVEWSLVAAFALAAPVLVLRLGDAESLSDMGWAVTAFAPALAAADLAWRQRGAAQADGLDWGLFGAVAATTLLLAFATVDLMPRDSIPAAWLLLSIGSAIVASRWRDGGTAIIAVTLAFVAAITAAAFVAGLWMSVVGSLFGEPAFVTALPPQGQTLLVLLLPGALLLLLARLLPPERRRGMAIIGAVFLLAGLYVPAKSIFSLADDAGFAARGLAERTLFTQALFLAGFLLMRTRAAALGTMLTALAAFRFVWFELIVHNPVAAEQWVGPLPLLNLLLPAYLGSAAWLYLARRRGGPLAGAWLALALAALIAGVMLMVRQLFQGAVLSFPGVPRGEFYGYSLAGLLLSVALLIGGIRLPDKALRVAALALLTATVVKVFLIDAAALEGVLRILSFLGLGIALIGVGRLYGKVLNAEAPPALESS